MPAGGKALRGVLPEARRIAQIAPAGTQDPCCGARQEQCCVARPQAAVRWWVAESGGFQVERQYAGKGGWALQQVQLLDESEVDFGAKRGGEGSEAVPRYENAAGGGFVFEQMGGLLQLAVSCCAVLRFE